MFQQNGLSLDQAPPISVVFRFFFAASLFGIVAGVLILIFGDEILSPTSQAAVILTHTLTLGVMASFMFGALFQMLPVIAGVVLSSPIRKSWLLQVIFIVGTVALLFAFALGYALLYWIASVFLAISLLSIIIVMLRKLLFLQFHTASSHGMMLALVSLGFVVLLALYLTATMAGVTEGTYYESIKHAHYSFGLFGWITLLIVAISFQVIEMFYVIPPYPYIVTKYLTTAIISLLFSQAVISLFFTQACMLIDILLSLLFIFYAVLTLYRLTQRKRPLADATIWFWRLGMSSLIVSMVGVLVLMFRDSDGLLLFSSIAFGSFALSIVFAMFYKIVPFLTWFHLNSQGYFEAPMMHEVIHPRTAKKHFWIHVSLIATLLGSLILPSILLLSSLLMMTSFAWVAYQVIHAHRLYTRIQATGEKFDMSGMDG